MLPKDTIQEVLNRIKTIRGQLGGIEKMLEDGKEPDQIIIQFKAAQKALHKVYNSLIDDVFRKGLALQLVDVMNACPGNCGEAEKIAALKKEFPQLKLSEITDKMQEVKDINDRMIKNNVKPKK